MKCKRCGSRCSNRESGYCFHCQIAVDIDKATGGKITDGTISEGFPDWEKPRKSDKTIDEQGLLF